MSTPVIPGGWSEWMEVTDEVKKICTSVKPEAEKKTHMKFTVFVPLNYRSQIVAGTNYEIKLYVGNDSCLFLRVFQAPDAKPELQKAEVLPLPSIILH